MTTEMNDQEFEQFLQQQMQQGDYIADDGFTDALMARLPASRPRRTSQLKARLFVGFSALLACVLVYFILPVQLPLQSIVDTISQPMANLGIFAAVGAGLMSIAALVLWNDRSQFFEL